VRQYDVPVAPLCSVRSIFVQSVTPKGKPDKCMIAVVSAWMGDYDTASALSLSPVPAPRL